MKTFQAILPFSAILLALALSAQSNQTADVTAIKAVLDAHGGAWTRGDAAGAAAVLTDVESRQTQHQNRAENLARAS